MLRNLRILRVELKRAIVNWKFALSVFIGCVFAALAFVSTPGFTIAKNWVKYMNGDEAAAMVINKMNMVDTPLEIWMPRYGSSSAFYSLWIFLLPVLIAIPYSNVYLMETKNGLINQFTVRVSKKAYYFSKFFALFTSGGLIAVIPLVFNLMLVMCFLPWGIPIKASMLYPMVDGNMFSKLFYTKPALYVLIYLLYTFVLFGLLSCLSIAIDLYKKNRLVAILIPFAVIVAEEVILTFGLGLERTSLRAAMNMYNLRIDTVVFIAVEFIIMAVVDIWFFLRPRKDVI